MGNSVWTRRWMAKRRAGGGDQRRGALSVGKTRPWGEGIARATVRSYHRDTPDAIAMPSANDPARPNMKITRISAYRVELPLHEGNYKWSGGKSVSVFDSTVVRVET